MRFFLDEELENRPRFLLGMRTEQDSVSPFERPSIEVGKMGERSSVEKTLPDEADGPFDTTFFVGPARRAKLRLEMVVSAKLEQLGVETSLWTVSLNNCCLEIVIKEIPGTAPHVVDGSDVPGEEVFERLVKEKLEVERSGIRQGQHKA